MSEYSQDPSKHSNISMDGNRCANEKQLWDALGQIPQQEPSSRVHNNFYSELDKRLDAKKYNQPSILERAKHWFGLNNLNGLMTATCCLIIGLALGQFPWATNSDNTNSETISSLQQQVASLHKNFVLDRLQDASANKRLLGVLEAKALVAEDPDIAKALLTIAGKDKVSSIRSAAIEVLGPQLENPNISVGLLSLLEHAQSPLVQLSLIEIVLRHGNDQQIQQLQKVSQSGMLHQDLSQTLEASLKPINSI